MNKTLIGTLLIMGIVAIPATIMAESEPPQVSLEGLELVEKTRRGELYADPGIDWSVYDKIQLDKATVAFRKRWQRDQNRYHSFKVKDSDVVKIKKELAELFDEVFIEELTTNGGYEIVDEVADNVMRITPRIVDLDVYAPDTPTVGINRQFTESAGRMTLKLEIYDSVTGDLIVSASDRRESRRNGYIQWTTRVSNSTDARRMLQRWAVALRERLDNARTTTAMSAD